MISEYINGTSEATDLVLLSQTNNVTQNTSFIIITASATSASIISFLIVLILVLVTVVCCRRKSSSKKDDTHNMYECPAEIIETTSESLHNFRDDKIYDRINEPSNIELYCNEAYSVPVQNSSV